VAVLEFSPLELAADPPHGPLHPKRLESPPAERIGIEAVSRTTAKPSQSRDAGSIQTLSRVSVIGEGSSVVKPVIRVPEFAGILFLFVEDGVRSESETMGQ